MKRRIYYKGILIFIVGVIGGGLILNITLPSKKYIDSKSFEIVSGNCTVEEDTDGRGYGGWWFNLDTTDKEYSIGHRPELPSYGENALYYCEVTVTQDLMWEIGYKVFDIETKEILYSHRDEQ